MALPVAGLISVASAIGIFGHHNDFPNGNPANLSKFDTIGRAALAGDAASLRFLQGVAAGQLITNGPGSVWYNAGDHDNPSINWGELTPGRAAERAYCARLVSGITGTVQMQPSIGQVPLNAPPGTDLSLTGQLEAIAARTESAGTAELLSRVATGAAAGASAANRNEQRASLVPNVTPTQVVIGLVAIVFLFLFLRKS